MKLNRPIGACLGALLCLSGCASPPASHAPATPPAPLASADRPADQSQYLALRATAEGARQQAAQAQGAWRDLDSLLEQADQAAATGDYRRAMELAREAQLQAELGLQQMQSQAGEPHPPYLRD